MQSMNEVMPNKFKVVKDGQVVVETENPSVAENNWSPQKGERWQMFKDGVEVRNVYEAVTETQQINS